MSKFLVTGGSGFIGTNLINYLVDNFPDSSILNLDIEPPRNSCHRQYFCICDVNDLDSLVSTVADFDPDYIFHLAASTGVGDTPLSEYYTNIDGVSNLISAAQHAISLKRIIFASSLLVSF